MSDGYTNECGDAHGCCCDHMDTNEDEGHTYTPTTDEQWDRMQLALPPHLRMTSAERNQWVTHHHE
jgi:hypothetical protein